MLVVEVWMYFKKQRSFSFVKIRGIPTTLMKPIPNS